MFTLRDFAEPGDTYTNFATGERYIVPAETPEQFIVWSEDREGTITATIKDTHRAAVRAYNKLTRTALGDTARECGWSEADTAEPSVRRAAGLAPFAS
jgi:hypothetical protein